MDPQDWIDRRRLRRKLGFWRIAAIVIAGLAVLALAFASGIGPGEGTGDQIARVEISGLITEDKPMLELLDELKDESRVKAVIVKVNSPGGTTVGGETLYHAVRELAAAKPVAAEVGTLAASAGYMIAMAGDRIVAHESSIVGSIGVIFQYVDASELLGRVGVDVEAVKSAPLKAEPSPFAPAPPEAREMIQRLVNSSFDWFVELFAERRQFDQARARALADGSVFTGRQGLDNGLVDALGGEGEVRRWLESERGVPKGLEIVEREPDRDDGSWGLLGGAKSAFFGWLGLDPRAESLAEAVEGKLGHLDGLLSLWQPPASR